MIQFKCVKCGETQNASEFYKSSVNTCGHVHRCKSCYKADVATNRYKKHEQYTAYDKRRAKEEYRSKMIRAAQGSYFLRNPERYRAAYAIHNAIRDGKLMRRPCEICNKPYPIEAHHDNYAKPLLVRWLCTKHHKQLHSGRLGAY